MKERNLQILSGFVLKVIALITMTFDHIGYFLMETNGGWVAQMGYVFRCVGRVAFPVLVMLCAEGVHYTKHPWKYLLRLLVMDLVIKLAMTVYFFGINPNSYPGAFNTHGNAFADLVLIALTLILLKQPGWKKALAILPFAYGVLNYAVQIYEYSQAYTIMWLPAYLRCDYSLMGVLLGLGFYFAYPLADRFSKPLREAISMSLESYRDTNAYRKLVNGIGAFIFFAVTLLFWGVSYITYEGAITVRPLDNFNMGLQTYALVSLPLFYFYSGKRGYDSKPMRWITYLYYPVHMAILIAIFWL